MTLTFFIFMFVLGICIGSFLNVVIYRTPKGESIVHGTSHCTVCQTPIKPFDLIPVISWIILKGKCRDCKNKISPRYLFVEALTGLLFALTYLAFGFSHDFYVFIIAMSVLVALSFIDIDHMEIPYWSTITLGALGLINLAINLAVTQDISSVLLEAAIGLLIITIPFGVLALLGGMGGGDVQLMAAAGLLLGYRIIPAALIGIFCGAVFGVILKYREKKALAPSAESIESPEEATETLSHEKQHTVMVFGPFLSLGIAVSALWGYEIIRWYLGIMGV